MKTAGEFPRDDSEVLEGTSVAAKAATHKATELPHRFKRPAYKNKNLHRQNACATDAELSSVVGQFEF
jgi:hypothetical protein